MRLKKFIWLEICYFLFWTIDPEIDQQNYSIKSKSINEIDFSFRSGSSPQAYV